MAPDKGRSATLKLLHCDSGDYDRAVVDTWLPWRVVIIPHERLYFLLFPTAEQCQAELRAYSYVNSMSEAHGYIQINKQEFLHGKKDDLGSRINWRGINLMDFDINTCTASNWKWFDTHSADTRCYYGTSPNCSGLTKEFISYLSNVTPESVLLGVTMDDPMNHLEQAFPTLTHAGIDVVNLTNQSMFAFVMQKGFAYKTVLKKSFPQLSAITLTLTITETSKNVSIAFCRCSKTVMVLTLRWTGGGK